MLSRPVLIDKTKVFELVCGDKSLLIELIRLFEEDYPKLLLEINSGLENREILRVQEPAHRLKGQLKNFFSEDNAKLAQFLENYSFETAEDEAHHFFQKLSVEIPKLVLELHELVNSSNFN